MTDHDCDKLSFLADLDNMRLLANCPEPLPDLELETVKSAIEKAGYGQCELDHDQLQGFVSEARDEAVTDWPVAELSDGEFEIVVSEDALTASLSVMPARGGRPVELAEVVEALGKEEIRTGLDQDKLHRVVSHADGRVHVIAQGQAPENGADAWFEPLVPEMVDRSPHIDEVSQRADFRDLGGVITVGPGDALIRRHPPTRGTPGEDVYGRAVAAEPGKDRQFKAGAKGVAVDDDDPDCLVATIGGQPIWKGDFVMVSPTLDLEQLDLSTGHIDFNGTVRVQGDVAHGMRISAVDDIQIGGVADGATLLAGGDVLVQGGVIGQRRAGGTQFNALVECEGSLQARFLEHVQVRCGAEVMIHDLVVHCDIEAGEKIVVGAQNTRKGHVLGGRYEAFELIRAVQLGNESSVETRVRVGNGARLEQCIRDIGNRVRDDKLPAATIQWFKTRQEELSELRARLAESARIIAGDRVYTKVTMQIGPSLKLFTNDKPGGTYRRRLHTIERDTDS